MHSRARPVTREHLAGKIKPRSVIVTVISDIRREREKYARERAPSLHLPLNIIVSVVSRIFISFSLLHVYFFTA